MILIWLTAVLVLIGMSSRFSSERAQFYGIAESRETKLNFEKAVEVKQVTAIPGQSISIGDTLALLDMPELRLKLAIIEQQLNNYATFKNIDGDELQSRIAAVRADFVKKKSEIQYSIDELERKMRKNLELTSRLESITQPVVMDDSENPLMKKISNYQKQLQLEEQSMRYQIEILKKSRGEKAETQKVRIQNLSREKDLIVTQLRNLVLTSVINGVVGSVNYGVGEKVSAFEPIMTVHSQTPEIIRGYIHEKIYSSIQRGDVVSVKSVADNHNFVTGEVVGVGARIVEFPLRLRSRPDISVWGREVSIRIPERNRFLLGEKVIISSK